MRPSSPYLPKVLSAGLVVVHLDGSRYRLLAVRTYDGWDFPKTHVAEGEDPLQAALRATRESTGLTDLQLKWGDEWRETLAFDDGRVSRYFLAESTTDAVSPHDTGSRDGVEEGFEHRWVTAEEAEDMLPPRLALILDWALARLATPR